MDCYNISLQIRFGIVLVLCYSVFASAVGLDLGW